jgi:CubicO group peptidase (beta-lactamase class C family)
MKLTYPRFRPFLLPFLVLILCRPAGPAAGPAAQVDAKSLDALVRDAMKAFRVPGAAVAVVKDDEVVHLKGYGVRAQGKDDAVSADTIFPIASASKAFTATAIAMLADEGKLSWDDPVRKHVEYFRLADALASENVTLRDLVCHRTGLSRHDLLWYDSPWSREQAIRKVGLVKLSQSFRQTFQYQNIMYAAAGEAIKSASGKSWEEFVAEKILSPLGMADATTAAAEAQKAADHARPHLVKTNDRIVVLESWRSLDNCAPAGAINASARSLTPWLRFNLGDGSFQGKKLLSSRRLKELHAPQMVIDMHGPTGVPTFAADANPETNVMTYGLGWVIQDYRGEHVVSHGGSIDGFRSQVVLLPRRKIGFAILCNLGRNSFPEALRNALIDHLLGLKSKDWNAHYLAFARKQEEALQKARDEQDAHRVKDSRPSRDLEAYAGAFVEPAYDRATVAVQDGRLTLRWSTYSVCLVHWHFDVFMVDDPKVERSHPLYRQQAVFLLDANGRVCRLQFMGQEFVRAPDPK